VEGEEKEEKEAKETTPKFIETKLEVKE